MTIPVIYSNATANIPISTPTQLSNTVGSTITLLDAVLVNGLNQLSITSINRVGTLATIELPSASPYVFGDTVEIASTGEPNFDKKHKVLEVVNGNFIRVRVADTGATTIAAAGTIKHPGAGWTKIATPGTNNAVYESGLLYDGSRRQIQIEDNNPYGSIAEFRVRICRGWTALNTATKISAARRFGKIGSNAKWIVIADDKTIYMNFNGTNMYCLGYAKEFSASDQVPFVISTGTDGSTQGIRFGGNCNSPATQTVSSSNCTFLDSINSLSPDNIASTTILGSLEPSAVDVTTKQGQHRSVNPLTGDLLLCPVDIWEKVSDTGQSHTLRARARGFYQNYGRILTNLLSDSVDFEYRLKSNNLNGSERILAALQAGYVNQVMVDISGPW